MRQFKVSLDRAYSVGISAEPLVGPSGETLVGQHIWAGRKLIINKLVPLRQRLEVLLHEAWHAWRCTNGQIMDEEIIADQFSACASAFFRQLLAQGGEPALMRLDENGVVDHDKDVGLATVFTYGECKRCAEKFSPDQIATSPMRTDEMTGTQVVDRSLYCEACNHIQTWHEVANSQGMPTGKRVGDITSSKDKADIARWIVKNGHKLNVFASDAQRELADEPPSTAPKKNPQPEPGEQRIVDDPWG